MKPPEQGHRRVGVAIDESRQNQLPSGVDRLGGQILGFEFSALANRDNRVTFYDYDSIVIDSSRSIHGHDSSSHDHQVDFLLFELS